uniref:Uncharacterized protein n=1 Tax=Manihot esculenta TaxID=3983 RepID=A0A2C9W1E9_MANES
MVSSEDLVPFICHSLRLVDTSRLGKKKHDVHLRVSLREDTAVPSQEPLSFRERKRRHLDGRVF